MGQLTYKIIIKKEHVRKERNMSKRVYISADYSESNGDRAVVDELHKWGKHSEIASTFCAQAHFCSVDCRSSQPRKFSRETTMRLPI